MVDRIVSEYIGKTTMSIIPGSSTKEVSTEFEEVLNTVSGTVKTSDGMDLDEIFNTASKTYGVPVYLLKAVARTESDFNTNAVSSSGAMGIMQLMPETAAELGVVNTFDPEENIMGGAKYLSEKLTEYNGDVELALAAYNAGSGNVEKYGGIPPFTETQNYVKKVTAYMEEYKKETQASGSQAASAKKESNLAADSSARVAAGTESTDTVSGYTINNAAMAAYERMKDETYWKVLQ